jgi:hypothetical protein
VLKENVKLHWLQRDNDGSTTVIAGEMDQQGAYGNWPEDFDKTELQAEKDYLDAVSLKDSKV